MLLSRRDNGVEGEGVWPFCCDHVEGISKHNMGEWFGKFNEDKFVVDKEGMGGGVIGQVMIYASDCQCGGEVQSMDECGGNDGVISLDGD